MPKVKDSERALFKKMFNDSVDTLSTDENGKYRDATEALKHTKLTQKDIRRRTNAAIQYIGIFSNQHREYDRSSVSTAICTFEAGELYWPEYITDEEYCYVGGVAIWILDTLKKYGKLDECCKILNSIDYELLEDTISPIIKVKGHSLYSDDLIETLYEILYEYRYNKKVNSDIAGIWKQIRELIPENEIESVICEATKLIDLYVKCTVNASIYFTGNIGCEKEKNFIQYANFHLIAKSGLSTESFKQMVGDYYSFIKPYYDEIYKKEIPLYGLCAAYYYMCEKEPIFSNLDAILQTVFCTIFALLPWHTKNIALGTDIWNIDYSIKDSVILDKYYSVYYPIFKYHSKEKKSDFLANFAQYYFLKTEKLLPYEDIPKSNIDFSLFSSDVALKLADYDKFISLINETGRLDMIGLEINNIADTNNFNDEDLLDENIDFDEDSDKQIDYASLIGNEESEDKIIGKLKSENMKFRERIDSLEQANYFQDKNYRALESKFNRLHKEYEICRKRMAELNEAIFNRDMTDFEEDDSEEQEIKVELPYSAVKNNVIFGGHPSWLKAIKGMLKNVKFVDNIQFSLDLIKNADIVWIQSNAISHSEYYKIVDATRLYNKSLHYFKHPSAIKCVKQFIEIDSE